MTIHAIFENGVFRPVERVDLPESCEVELEIRQVKDEKKVPTLDDRAQHRSNDYQGQDVLSDYDKVAEEVVRKLKGKYPLEVQELLKTIEMVWMNQFRRKPLRLDVEVVRNETILRRYQESKADRSSPAPPTKHIGVGSRHHIVEDTSVLQDKAIREMEERGAE
jgi:predicted DNA-binding antitoxin AbrB/MazE fold protein